ncbi:MAG: response regulator transcription factor [Vampirovibrionales bacterium]|nr:response regulator transcription factor [Vampirovibrionales bacterium]
MAELIQDLGSPVAPAGTIQLLLVEDHPMTRMGLRILLEQAGGFTIIGEAATGRQAVAMASENPPDVVLMDIGLPEMDGIAATQHIKKQFPSVRILMLTSKDSEQDVLAALAAGADAYCMKGIATDHLMAAIRAVHEGASWLDPAIARIVLARFQGKASFGAVSPNAALMVSNAPVSQSEKPVKPVDCPLTARELEVLKLIVDGLSNPEIAEKLVVTKATAKAHVHSILQKLCVDDRTQAAVLAMRQGFV